MAWREEAEAEGRAVAWAAIEEYDPGRGVPILAFLRRRVVVGVWSRYRREWAFGRRTGPGPAVDPEERTGELRSQESLDDIIGRLTTDERWLIRSIFWEGRTEADIAGELGISQPAVSKRRRRILKAMRRRLQDRGGQARDSGYRAG
jgi:RNA polymerase sigma factor (sigma-70 family)